MCSPFTQAGCCSFFRAVVLVQEEYSDEDAGHNALWNSNTTLTKPLPQYPHAQYPHAFPGLLTCTSICACITL